MRGGGLAILLAGTIVLSAASLFSPSPGPTAIEVTARPIPRFDSGEPGRTRFGMLDYVGGFSYSSRTPWLAGVSGIRLLGSDRFLAVTDTGLWFSGAIRRNQAGVPVGMTDTRLAPILNPGGQPSGRKGEADAEGLAIDNNGDALVSFERNARIAAYPNADAPYLSRPRFLPLTIPRRELRMNAGLEAIAVAPPGSPLAGRAVVVSEKSLDADGNLFAAILGNNGGVFKVKRDEPWSATDGTFLAGGDFLLLERRYQGLTRVGMRIRRIDGAAIRPGAVVDGTVLIEADLSQEIDNMEGIDTYRAADGSTRIVVVSDDNASFFQRNLFLEFKLAEPAPISN